MCLPLHRTFSGSPPLSTPDLEYAKLYLHGVRGNLIIYFELGLDYIMK